MRRYWWEAVLVIAVACEQACGRNLSPGSLDPGSWQERVASEDACLDIGHCVNFAPFYHPSIDPNIGLVRWVVSESGRACVVGPFDNYYVGGAWTCRWRNRRG